MKLRGSSAAPPAPGFCELSSRRVSLLCLASILALCICDVAGHEVYLREMTIHKDHESGLHGSKPEVYMSCEADDRGKISLDQVKHTETKYQWGEGEIAITYVGDDECRKCTLKEADWPDSDDTFGTVDICAKHFSGEEGMKDYSVPGEFDAHFQCKDCVAAEVPSTLPEGLRLVNSTELAEAEDDEERAATQEEKVERVLGNEPAIQEWLREHGHNASSTNMTHNMVSTNQSQSGASHNSSSQRETIIDDGNQVVHVRSSESQSSANGISTSTKAVVVTSEPSHSKGGHKSAVVPIVVVLTFCSLLAGVIAGALLYRSHQARVKRQEEEKMKELEAILGDPNVDFEEMATQDNKAMNWNLNLLSNWRQRMWNKVPDAPEKPGDRPQPGTKI